MLATKQREYHSLKSGTHTPNHQERQLIAHLSLRIQTLKQSGAIDVSPWDGMDDYLTAEVTYHPIHSYLFQVRVAANTRNRVTTMMVD